MSTTKKPKLAVIRPQTGFAKLTDAELLLRLNAVHDGLTNNAAYPSPPVDMPGFKATIDALTAAVAALDGGKVATVNRDKRRNDAIIMLRSLAHYAESACKNDMPTFVSSGFVAASATKRQSGPVGVPSITSVDPGPNSGTLVVSIKAVTGARHYDVHYAPAPAAGSTAAINWITVLVPSTKPPAPIADLTPGTTYTFQVRAFGKLGYSDWSSPVFKMCV